MIERIKLKHIKYLLMESQGQNCKIFSVKQDIPYANVCLSSKKDLRNAVVAARNDQIRKNSL